MCSGIMQAELHRGGVCGEGATCVSLSVSVPEQSQFCRRRILRASPVDTTQQHPRRCALAARPGVGRERFAGELEQLPSFRLALPPLHKATHPRNDQPSQAHAAL